MAGIKLTPIILKQVNKYLTTPKKVRKFGFDDTPVKTGEDIERPQKALDREMFKDAEERFNKADGGRIGFAEGTFKFKDNIIPINIKGLTKRSTQNVQNLLTILENNPNISPKEWFAKTSKVQGASSGLDQLSRDLLKYIKGDTKNLSGAISKEVFDKLNIKNLIKDEIPNLNTISGKAFTIKLFC